MRKYLTEHRKQKGLTQQYVANALGVSRQYYQQIEAGQRQQKLELFLASKLASVFQLSLHELLEQEADWAALRDAVLRAHAPAATKAKEVTL